MVALRAVPYDLAGFDRTSRTDALPRRTLFRVGGDDSCPYYGRKAFGISFPQPDDRCFEKSCPPCTEAGDGGTGQ